MVKNLPAMRETQVRSLSWEDPLEKGMATHSSILAWRMLWTEEPGGLQSMGSQRVRHDWVINTLPFLKDSVSVSASHKRLLSTSLLCVRRRKWDGTSPFCQGTHLYPLPLQDSINDQVSSPNAEIHCHCYEMNGVPPTLHGGVLTPRTPECHCIWRRSFKR